MSQVQSQSQGNATQNSQSQFSESTVRTSRPLVPTTIKQLRMAEQPEGNDSKFTIDGKEIYQCKIIGQIMSVDNQSTTTTYMIDDGTSSIAVKIWRSRDGDDEKSFDQTGLHEYVYVRAFGRLIEYQGRRSLTCYKMAPIEDFNEITCHRLEAVQAHLHNTRGPVDSASQKMKSALGSQNGTGSQVSGSGFGQNPNPSGMGFQQQQKQMQSLSYQHGLHLTPEQDQVYSAFAEFKDNEDGVDIKVIMSKLSHLPAHRVQQATEFLLGEGHLFSTTDDNHFSLCM